VSVFITTNRAIIGAALLLPFGGSLWLFAARDAMSASSFAAGASLVLGAAAVSLKTWRSVQPTGSIGQVIHEVDRGAR